MMGHAVRHKQVNQGTTFTEKVGSEKRACAAKDGLKKNNIFSTYYRLLHQKMSLKGIIRPD
jgi:hypothetical protein